MATRRTDLLDAAIALIGDKGIRVLTHRAVDAAVGLPSGSTSNYFRTSDALLNAVVERFAERERAIWESIAAVAAPTTPAVLARVAARFVHESVGPHRTLTLARYAILVEAANYPALRAELTATWFIDWMRVIGSTDPGQDAPIVMNYVAGLVLHQLSNPDPNFDATERLTRLVKALVP